MSHRPLHQWLKHAYRSHFLSSFGERRRIFAEGDDGNPNEEYWRTLEDEPLASFEPEKPFEVEIPSEEEDFIDIAEGGRVEQFLIDQINRKNLSVWELDSLLDLEGVKNLFTKDETKELKQFFDLVSSRRSYHETLIKHEVEEVVARKYTEHILRNNLSNEEAENYVRNQEVEEKKEIERRVREQLSMEFENFRRKRPVIGCIKKTKRFLEGRQNLRINALGTYLKGRAEAVRQKYDKSWSLFNKDDPIGPESTLTKVEMLLEGLDELDEKGIQNAARWMGINIDPKANQTSKLLTLANAALNKIKGVEYDIQTNLSTLEEASEHREAIRQSAEREIGRKIDFMRSVKIEQLRFFQGLCESNQADGTKKENASSARYLGRLIELIETTELRQGVINNEEELIRQLGTMSVDELMEVNQHYQHSNEYLSQLMNFDELKGKILEQEGLKTGEDNLILSDTAKTAAMGRMAGRAITQIEGAKTPGEIIKILSNTIGEDKFEITSNFSRYEIGGEEVNLKKYTSNKGGMVFYDHGPDSKIIIDAEQFYGEGINPRHLVDMIVHELRHVKLEHTPGLKKKVINSFKRQPIWGDIQELFKKLGKRPPYDTEFNEESTAHEIYAMRNDLGKGKTSKAARRRYRKNLKKIALFDLNDLIYENKFYEKTIDVLDDPQGERDNLLKEIGKVRGAEEGVSAEDLETGESTSQSQGKDESNAQPETKGGGYDKNRSDLEEQKKRVEELKKSKNNTLLSGTKGELNDIDRFLKRVESENESLKDKFSKGVSKLIQAAIEKAKGGLDNVKSFFDEIGDEKDEKGGFFSGFLNRTNVISIQAIIEGIKSGVETYTRRRDRTQKEGGERGLKAVMGNTAIGQEASSNLAKLEDEQVNDWKFDTEDPMTLENKIGELSRKLRPDKHQLKALMRTLADKGRLNWQSPNLLRALNKVQSAVRINPHDPKFESNQVALDNVLKKAIGSAYDLDEYPDLLRKNESAYSSKKNEFFEVHKKDPSGLTKKLETALMRKKNGDNNVDPIEYESILEFCIRDGKSEPDWLAYHLIAGIAAGVLPPNRAAVLEDGYMNKFPALDYIININPQTQKGYRDICEKYFSNDFKRGKVSDTPPGGEFKTFFYTVIGNHGKVHSRTEASAINHDWDHDHMHGTSAFADAETLKITFGSKSGEPATKDTGKDNHLVGFMRYLENNANNYKQIEGGWQKTFTRMAASAAMTDGMFSGVAYPNERRSRYGNKAKIPREGGMGHHPKWDLGDYQKKMKDFLLAIDPTFYGTLLNGDLAGDKEKSDRALKKIKEHLSNNYGFNVGELNSLDSVFDRISAITSVITSKNKGKLEDAITQVAATKSAGGQVISINRGRFGEFFGGRKAA